MLPELIENLSLFVGGGALALIIRAVRPARRREYKPVTNQIIQAVLAANGFSLSLNSLRSNSTCMHTVEVLGLLQPAVEDGRIAVVSQDGKLFFYSTIGSSRPSLRDSNE